ncbi:MAG: DUF559 domain-containing protein [Gammaproteobacteria bacterium]|nr:DUF559 domain-containing protein [Gammaproteobacteria bacterium]
MNTRTMFSRHLRRNMSDAEHALWRHLRLRQIKGYKFRRQHPWRSYVLDFVCLEAKLIVEVDGGQHQRSRNGDSLRTSKLEAEGFQVLRFWNNEVLTNIEGVKAVIWNSLPDEISPPIFASLSCFARLPGLRILLRPFGGTKVHWTFVYSALPQSSPCRGKEIHGLDPPRVKKHFNLPPFKGKARMGVL